MKSQKNLLVVATFLGVLAWNAGAATFDINPQTTYLRTSADSGTDIHTGLPESALDALPIDLTSIGLAPGDSVSLRLVGSYYYWWRSVGAPDYSETMLGVFSSTAELFSNGDLNRVAGAIEAGADAVSLATYYDLFPTDIAQDFSIPSAGVIVEIPAGAAYLFVSPQDVLFWDNAPGPDGYHLVIERMPTSVPDIGSTLSLLAVGMAAMAGIRAKRREA